MPVILREREADRIELIAEIAGNSLPISALMALPETLDLSGQQEPPCPAKIAKKLYVSGRLIGPYQIDTDRFPFTARFF